MIALLFFPSTHHQLSSRPLKTLEIVCTILCGAGGFSKGPVIANMESTANLGYLWRLGKSGGSFCGIKELLDVKFHPAGGKVMKCLSLKMIQIDTGVCCPGLFYKLHIELGG